MCHIVDVLKNVSLQKYLCIYVYVSDKFLESFRTRHVALIEHDEASHL